MVYAPNSSLDGDDGNEGRIVDIVEGVFIVVLAVIAIIGNGLIIYVIYRNRTLHVLRNLFIASLSLSDFCMGCTDVLYQGIGKLVPNYKPPHFSFCYFVLFCGVLFGSASVFNLTAMTINRYIAISYPLHYSQYVTSRRSAMILLLLWLAACCLALPPLLWRPVDVVCYSTTPSEEHLVNEIAYMAAEWIFWFVIPALIILVAYCRIYRIAKNQARQIAAMEMSQQCAVDENPTNQLPGAAKTMNPKLRISTYKEKKAGRMVTILIGFWLFCWLPFFTVLTIHKFLLSEGVPPILMRIFLGLMFMNSAGNPLLLTMYNKEMKVALHRLFSQRASRGRNSIPSNEVELTSVRRVTHPHVTTS
ncbi:alpha-1A adrenergic receptor-like [Actinia tenebrosa]|uniref:Alpha-1A adrenergic receptor-like n=1 Tax=Actinia tenebrosa TaxID=6105 RepID=A0A6P8IDN2_ACTTE|nr:alpha-1A adrenergic receptor-like [Actinia tenebrosa]